MHRKVAVAIAAALALTVASCGGSESTTLSRAALVRRVETACRQAQAVASRTGRAGDPIAAFQAGVHALVERISDLEASGDARADFDAYKEATRTRSDLIDKIASASRADRPRLLRSVQREADEAGRKISSAAERLGLSNCS